MKNKPINTGDRMVEIIKKSECPCQTCQTTGAGKTNAEIIYKIIDLENYTGKQVTINSGRRCPAYNASVGGYPSSPHLTGYAEDITMPGMTILELARVCEKIGFKRIGIYPDHIHVDMIDPHPSRFWYVRKYGEAPIYSKGIKTLEEFIKKVTK